MATINHGSMPPERILTIGDFVENVYLPWAAKYTRPATASGYRIIWEAHLKPICEKAWLKETRAFNVQRWLDQIGANNLGRNTLKHIKSTISGIFTVAIREGYFPRDENPVRYVAIDPAAKEPEETHAYTLEEIRRILAVLPEPAATAFAVAAYAGLRRGEIQGLHWEDYRDGELHVSRSIWNGVSTGPKTRKSGAPVPVIRQLSDRLEMHRLRVGKPQEGPIFAYASNKPMSLTNLQSRIIVPALNSAGLEWHGWHAARRGLSTNLFRLGVPDMKIQQILRHGDVNTTRKHYIKPDADDARGAMDVLEGAIEDLATDWPLEEKPTVM